MSTRPETLPDVLHRHAQFQGGRPAYTFLPDGETVGVHFTFAGLSWAVRALSGALSMRAAPGDRLLVLQPDGVEFYLSFLACLGAGLVAVPAHAPQTPSGPEEGTLRYFAHLAKDCSAEAVVTSREIYAGLRPHLPEFPELERLSWILTDEVGLDHRAEVNPPQPTEPAFIQ